jgi:DNA replication initiation complex subunit (GINS family)
MDAPITMLQECYRTIGTNGAVLILYGAIEQIEDDVVHRFFPKCLELDRQRTPKMDDVESYLKEAGFKRIETVEIVQQSYHRSIERVEAIKRRTTSILNLITDEEFETGLKNLLEYYSIHMMTRGFYKIN